MIRKEIENIADNIDKFAQKKDFDDVYVCRNIEIYFGSVFCSLRIDKIKMELVEEESDLLFKIIKDRRDKQTNKILQSINFEEQNENRR